MRGVRRFLPWPVAAALVALTVVLVGCGGGGGGEQRAARTKGTETNGAAKERGAAGKQRERAAKRQRRAARKGHQATKRESGGTVAGSYEPGHKKSGRPQSSKRSRQKQSGQPGSGQQRPSGTSAPRQGGGSLAPGHATVIIQGLAFEPPRVTIRVGGYVYWVNKDHVEHTATSKSGPTPPRGHYRPPASPYIGRDGGTYTDFFRQRGTYYYVCTIHPTMHGYVVVK